VAPRRQFKGKLIGALVGSLAGPVGTALGGLLGHLFDKADEEQRELGSLRPGGCVSRARLDFLSSLIGLSVAVTEAGGEAGAAQIETLKGFFRENFPCPEEDQRTLEEVVDECFRRRRELEVLALCRHYSEISSPAGRLLLVRLLFKIATAAREGPELRQLERIRWIAAELGVQAAALEGIEAEFLSAPGGAEGLSATQAYAILGITCDAPDAAVRSRYRRMAAQHHPDRVANLGEELVAAAEEKFKLLAEAYALIGRERGWKAGST